MYRLVKCPTPTDRRLIFSSYCHIAPCITLLLGMAAEAHQISWEWLLKYYICLSITDEEGIWKIFARCI